MVAFNWGGGGAVDGQAAETYLLRRDGSEILLSPARETMLKYLPQHGGVEKKAVHFGEAILNPQDKKILRELVEELRRRLPGIPAIGFQGPFDVELGFLNGAAWLFQVRPFVGNKSALSATYLQSMDSGLPRNVQISLRDKLTE